MNRFRSAFKALFAKSVMPARMYGNRGWDNVYQAGINALADSSSVWEPLTTAQLEAAYSINPVVRACVARIGTSLADPRIEVGEWKTDRTWSPATDSPELALVRHPNKFYTRNDLISYISTRLILTGIGYVWALPNITGSGPPAELWPIPTSWVKPIGPSKGTMGTDIITGYKIHGQGERIFPYEAMISVRDPDPASTAGYSSRLQSCLHDFSIDRKRESYVAQMLKNLAITGPVIRTDYPMTPVQKQEMEDAFLQKFGDGNHGKPAFMSGAGEIIPVNPLEDMDWPGLTDLSETRMCAGLGVPPIIVHFRAGLNQSTYSNYRNAKRTFYTGTLVPLWTAIAEALTRTLLPRQDGKGLEFRFRYDELPEFQDDQDDIHIRIRDDFKAGLITRQQANDVLGYEYVASPDMPDISLPGGYSVSLEEGGARKGQGEAPKVVDIGSGG